MPVAALLRLTAPLVFAQQPTGGLYNSPSNFASWTDNQSTHVANAVRSPDGQKNAVLIVEDTTASSGHYIQRQVVTSIAAQAYTFSAYFKRAAGNRNAMLNSFSSTFGSSASAGINFDTGLASLPAAATGSWSGASAVVTPLQQGWFKLALTFTAAVDTSIILILEMMQGGSTGSYTGDGASSIAAWGVDFR